MPESAATTDEYLDLTFPLVITRHGGLDGVALQKVEYGELLRSLDVKIHLISGREEKEFGEETFENQTVKVEERLYFLHPISRLLYGASFAEGPETKGSTPLDKDEWLEIFEAHKEEIKAVLDAELSKIPNNTPVVVYNLLALRHMHPAAAVAVRELIEKYPNRGFISHAADPDAERPEKISRLKPHVLEVISANPQGRAYSGGPYHLNNLYHIVLNPTQYTNFLGKYEIPENHVFEIPDFLPFRTRELALPEKVEPGFLSYLECQAVISEEDRYTYVREEGLESAMFVVSPVRPVYRKRLKEAMLASAVYARTRAVKVAFVVTHPDLDDPEYFLETVRFAESIDLPYLHIGRDFTVETLEYAYRNLAVLNAVGVVASSAGGWENALNEMAAAGLPFYMSSTLNSYVPLTETIGIETLGINFDRLEAFVNEEAAGEWMLEMVEDWEEVKTICAWMDEMGDSLLK